MGKQIKSKQRVAEHGEVFTAKREVNAMLDLVKDETEQIDSRFLEPACGDGNFLTEILRRKLTVVKKRYGKVHSDYEKYAVVAVTSIYGVELLQDNVEDCRERLFSIWNNKYTANCKKDASDECREAVRFILSRNILCGSALTMETDSGSPIIFSEWSIVTGNMIKRRDFRFDVLMKEDNGPDSCKNQISFFDNADNGVNWEIDSETHKPIPKPIREFPPTDYRRVQQYE